jgi:hypothetical protein
MGREPEIIVGESLLVRSKLVSWGEFQEQTGTHASRIGELIELGWIEPITTSDRDYLFRVRDVYRLRKLERLMCDLEVNLAGACIIVDLVERVECLEKRVRDLERLL